MFDSLWKVDWSFSEDWLFAGLFFFALLIGFILGRRSRKNNHSENSQGIHKDYFKGLNFVLNEQPDKAIEVFVKMLEVDSETVETHLALGNLFRRRGEVDRAIRIHQNLIARPTLNKEQRSLALLQLGMDYMASGLLDRAEGLFLELIHSGEHKKQAYRELLNIYQQEKDWDKAIDAASNLQSGARDIYSKLIAQFYCEQVEEAIGTEREADANNKLRKALRMDPLCVRASLLEGKLASRHEQYRQAVKSYLRIEKQDPDFLSETIVPLKKVYSELDKTDEFKKYLDRIIESHGSIRAMLHMVTLLAENEGKDKALKYITNELQKRPSVRGVDRMIEYVVDFSSGETKESLMTIKDLTGKLLAEKSYYRCNHCGYSTKTLHWRCPTCKTWASVKPIQGVSGE